MSQGEKFAEVVESFVGEEEALVLDGLELICCR